jgi:hypothetical protein
MNSENVEQPMLPVDPPIIFETDPPEPDPIDVLRAENEELKASIRMRDAREEITASLRSAGARSPELMFDAAKGSIQFGEDGGVENAAALVGELRRKFPEQFGTHVFRHPSVDGGAGTHASPNILTKEALAKMKPNEIAKLDWAEVRQVLSER